MVSLVPGAFGPFGGRAWLNTAHQGPLPAVAAALAAESVEDKRDPRRIGEERFFTIPPALRATLGELVGAPPEEIVLGNSTTHGLDLLARGLPLRAGDEVLVAEGDFPATVYPWLPLERRGVRIRRLPAPAGAPEPDDLREALSDRTRVVCTSWVFSFTGRAADVPALAAVCRDHGDALLVVNGSQAVGARPVDVRALGADALVSCGFKWLCGPYATGFTWIRRTVLDRLEHEQGYWLAQMHEIGEPETYRLRDDLAGAAHDVFCTANLSTYPAWEAAVRLLLDTGLDAVEAHDQGLVQRLVDGLPPGWRLRSPTAPAERSTLVFVAPEDRDGVAPALERLDAAGVDAGERAGMIRLTPHLHNDQADVDRALAALAAR